MILSFFKKEREREKEEKKGRKKRKGERREREKEEKKERKRNITRAFLFLPFSKKVKWCSLWYYHQGY